MKHHGTHLNKLRRLLSGLLCAAVLCGLLPQGLSLVGTAKAAEAELSWSDEDLETLRGYDIMRGDEGGMRPNDTLRRSEFAAMVNRALGYKELADKTPFTDVKSDDWFADDISISYNIGYLQGVTNTTAGPNSTLTREQALVILGRNMMLQPAVGESFNFADSRTFREFSRGYIDPAIEAGIIDADRNGDFNPTKEITRGELAGMLLRSIGTPVQSSGVKNLGTVDGNVTITTAGTTLRNTVINGDLYLSGGIGLGDVHLDNVTVNGKIVDAGAGRSEKGEISVVLNNVTAEELVVDSIRDQAPISLRTSGNTSIPKASIRTSASLDDSTSAGYGLELIEIDGKDGTAVTLSGNIKEVHNKTPNSKLNMGEGIAEKITVDEAATGSTLTMGKDARIMELNLDAGIKVDGAGNIDKVNIGADGATVAQMPDEIVIAPGITATVNKKKMDTADAVEASSRPRLASGYPVLEDLTPTGASGMFETNKPGTVYWAVTALSDGSPSEDDIISPPTYSKTILKSGKVQVKESDKEYTAKISGLTSDGSYYLSAIMVDDRGTRSTMKVTAFTTPDNTTPAFAKGYPAEEEISEQNAQFAIMTTKSCNLYYALLPKGSTAPRAIDFKAGSISGNLGYGVVKMEKNNPANIFVNDVTLEEQKDYVLYLWLNDFDGAKSSAVKSVNFTTQDKTNPIVSNMRQTDTKANSATMAFTLNEQGTLYWAVVPSGNETFMSPSATTPTGVPFLQTQEAKERVVSGVGALKKGTSSVSSSKAGTDVGFTVSGLDNKKNETSTYDLYYVAKDKAGNWSETVRMVTIYTLDNSELKAELKFNSFNQGEDEDTKEPLADTDIRIVFSKAVRVVEKDGNGVTQSYAFLDLYQDGKTTELADILRRHVTLYKTLPNSGTPVLAQDELTNQANYDIDYSKVKVSLDGSKLVLEFPYDTDSTRSAHHLSNGGDYYFELTGIQDTSTSPKTMGKTQLKFKTKQAQINISSPGITELDNITENGEPLPVDFSFQLNPKATSSSPEGMYYDILLWCDENLTFDLYKREGTSGAWSKVGSQAVDGVFKYSIPATSKEIFRTVAEVQQTGSRYPYEELKDLKEDVTYQYAIHIVTLGSSNKNRSTWHLECNMGVSIASGVRGNMDVLAKSGTTSIWQSETAGRVNSLGNPVNSADVLSFKDASIYSNAVRIKNAHPVLSGNFPVFSASDTTVEMTFLLDSPGTISYVVTPVKKDPNSGDFMNPVPPTFARGDNQKENENPESKYNEIPQRGQGVDHALNATKNGEIYVSVPEPGRITNEESFKDVAGVFCGHVENGGVSAGPSVTLTGLDADTWYYVYLVFQGKDMANRPLENAVCYRFKTNPANTPVITLQNTSKDGEVNASIKNSSADVASILMPEDHLENSLFGLKLDGSNKKAGSELDFDFTVPGAKPGNYTIYSAIESGDFDKLASDMLKQKVASEIIDGRSTYGNAIYLDQKKLSNVLKDSSGLLKFDESKMSYGVKYTCIAVATNTSNDTVHGFGVLRPVEKVDTRQAIVMDASPMNLYFTYTDTSANPNDPDSPKTRTFKLTGGVRITFEGYLYARVNGVIRPFTQDGRQTSAAVPGDGTDFSEWAGVQVLKSLQQTAFKAKEGNQSIAPSLTQELLLTYDDPSRTWTVPWECKQVQTGVDKDGKPTYTTQYVPPAYPEYEGDITVPSEIINSNGTIPKNLKKVHFTNVDEKTGATKADFDVSLVNK